MKSYQTKRAVQSLLVRYVTKILLGACLISASANAEEDLDRGYLGSFTGVWDGPPLVDGIPQDGTTLHDDILIPPPSKLLRAAGCGSNSWPEGIIPFAFHVSVSPVNRLAVLEAMDLWMTANARIAFVQRTIQGDFILIYATNKNTSYVGRVGGNQVLNLVNFGAPYIIAHELCHALGFWHEQSRPDRDTYVEINSANIAVDNNQCGGSCAHNFAINSCWMPGSLNTPYDFLSVMHYSQCAFSTAANCPSGGRTILCRPAYAAFQNQIGNLSRFGTHDVQDMQQVYGVGRSFFLDGNAAASGNGTLARPWNALEFPKAANAINSAGQPGTLYIRGGMTYPAAGTYNQPGTFTTIPNTGPATLTSITL